MRAYIVEVIPKEGLGKVSQEGYTTLEKAQAFIGGRSDRPTQVSPFLYRSSERTYLIYDVKIV